MSFWQDIEQLPKEVFDDIEKFLGKVGPSIQNDITGAQTFITKAIAGAKAAGETAAVAFLTDIGNGLANLYNDIGSMETAQSLAELAEDMGTTLIALVGDGALAIKNLAVKLKIVAAINKVVGIIGAVQAAAAVAPQPIVAA